MLDGGEGGSKVKEESHYTVNVSNQNMGGIGRRWEEEEEEEGEDEEERERRERLTRDPGFLTEFRFCVLLR